MREIKFRGKRIDNGEWMFGDLSTKNSLNTTLIYPEGWLDVEVDPSTVGQYTGLKDKNGTEIYEGDIVSPSNSWNPELKFVVTFGEGVFDSGYYSFTGFYLISDDGRQGEDQYELSKDSVYEIIGNIHDTPKGERAGMERLTARTEKGHAYLVNVKPDEQEVNSPHKNTLQCILDCFERLAAYEDTGLTPEQCAEYAQAEADGRLVVLPYPIGTKVYIIIRHGVLHDKILENVVCGYSESEWQGSINKGKDSRFVICHNSYNMPNAYELRDVFLTRADAEAALAAWNRRPEEGATDGDTSTD